ncbi:MAG: TlpA family protein disulfide reductase [Acidobacteriaceae bacterium]
MRRLSTEFKLMNTMRVLAIAGTLLIFTRYGLTQNEVAPGIGAGTENPRVVLDEAASALLSVRTITYSADAESIGSYATRGPSTRGEVKIEKTSPVDGSFRIASSGFFTPSSSALSQPFHDAFDGSIIYKQSPGFTQVKTVDARDVPQKDRLGFVTGNLGPANLNLLLVELLMADPLGRERSASKIDYEGRAAVDGVLCDVVYVEFPYDNHGNGAGTARERWFIGQKDHLPRRWETIGTDDDGRFGEFRVSLAHVRANEPIPISAFRLANGVPVSANHNAEQSATLLRVGEVAPAWQLADASGSIVSMHGLHGNYVLLDFWTTTCAPCVRSLPELERLSTLYKQDHVNVLAVTLGDTRDSTAYLKKKGYTFQALLAGDKVAIQYRASVLPTTYLIDPNGTILYSGHSLPEAEKILAEQQKRTD